MEMLTATVDSSSTLLPLVIYSVGRNRGRMKLTGSDLRRVSVQFLTFDERRQLMFVKSGLARFRLQSQFIERRRTGLQSKRIYSAVICCAALNARCAAEQTQTVTREAPTITHLPGKEKSPQLDDGGSGFPPRDDGDGGGGGGGGGGNWSGGFFFFGFLAFLGFLKDKESEGPYRDDRRR